MRCPLRSRPLEKSNKGGPNGAEGRHTPEVVVAAEKVTDERRAVAVFCRSSAAGSAQKRDAHGVGHGERMQQSALRALGCDKHTSTTT